MSNCKTWQLYLNKYDKSKVGKTVKGINVIIISLDIFLSDVSKGTVFLHWSLANCGFRTLIRYKIQ